MKMKAGKRVASFFLSACIALSVLLGAVIFASAETVPTSESISELKAVYSYAENESGTGTVAVDAKAQNVEAEEYVMFYIYQNVDDIADPTNGRQNAQVTSKGFYAADILSGEALAKELPLTPLKLNGKCVLGVQVTNRGDNNDWVYEYITTALKLDANGGTLIGDDEIQVKLGFGILDELGNEERATRDYYRFVGWSETADGEAIGDDLLMTQYGEELFALWEQLTTTVTFDANGGEGDMDPIVVNAGEATDLPECEFTYSGKKFIGWGTEADGPVVYDGTEPITLTGAEDELALYAIWEDIPFFTVTFNANGGEGEMEPQEAEAGVATALNGNEFTRIGYKYQGWSTTADGEVEYEDGDEITLTDSDIELFAVWKKIPIAVYYSPNGGEGLMNPRTVTAYDTIILDKSVYTQKGKSFIGWSTTADGAVEYEDEEEFTIGEKSVVLYAVWKNETRALLFSPNGGTGLMTPIKGLTEGTPVTLPEVQYSRKGYDFIGWSTTADGAVEYEDCAEFTPGGKNQVLYAVWAATV